MMLCSVIGKRRSLPVIHVRGTFYEVGYDVGRTVSSLIQGYMSASKSLNERHLSAYHTQAGREIYDTTLASLRDHMPQYVEELKGIADGANVPFYKLFLLHLDEIMSSVDTKTSEGCTSVICNQEKEVILGHNEDGSFESVNHCYIVSATITEPSTDKVLEEFTAFCYPGYLPGKAMGYNTHGLVMSMTRLGSAPTQPGRTPRPFLMRSLLSAQTPQHARDILSAAGHGIANGLGVSVLFYHKHKHPTCHNYELAPSETEKGSILNVIQIVVGDSTVHCNNYLRLDVGAAPNASSTQRHTTLLKLPAPNNIEHVKDILGDKSDKEYPFYRDATPPDLGVTIATGLFNITAKTWSIYTENPKVSKPLMILPMVFNND